MAAFSGPAFAACAPGIGLDISGVFNGTTTDAAVARPGDVIDYTVTVSLTVSQCPISSGNVSLTLPNTTVISLSTTLSLSPGGSAAFPGNLYTVADADIGKNGAPAGAVRALAAASAIADRGGGITQEVTATTNFDTFVIHPHTTLTKTASPTSGTVPPGLLVTYTYTETNDSVDPVTLQPLDAISSVSVADDKCSPVTFVTGDTNTNGKLDVGETWTFTCTHTYNAGDPGVPGTITNTATATGTVVGDGHDAPAETAQARVNVILKVKPTVATEIHAGSNTAPLPHTVITSATAGSTVHDHATVSPPATPPGLPTPEGTVTFSRFDNGTCTAPAASTETKTLSSGSAESSDFVIPTTGVTAISYQVHYTPDVSQANTYTEADSPCEPLTVTPLVQALTPGYWKTHEAATTALLPQTLGSFTVSDFATASAIFNAMNCSNSSRSTQNAVGCLAGHLLAAKLNVANGASACIAPTITAADAFLISVGYVGPTGTYTLTPAQRATAISLKSTLDTYNNTGTCT